MSRRMNKLWWAVLAALLLAAAIPLAPLDRILPTEAEPTAPVLIIDAGHGGADGGAIAPDGTLESELNLDIAQRLNAIAVFCGIETVMTRESEAIDYPVDAQSLSEKKKADQNARVELIRSYPDAVLISIHQNNYPAASPRGIQVFYGSASDSDRLAGILQTNLTAQLCQDNRRLAEPIDDGIYLMRKAACRAVLVECGFLSNPEELAHLKSEEYRTQLAVVLLASYIQYLRGATI